MKSVRLAIIFAIIFGTSALITAQTAPNIENGFKSYGSYHGSDIDTINLQNGNVSFHIPLFSYPQRGKLPLRYWVQGNSKNWQVGQYFDKQNNTHYRWMLSSPGDLYFTSDYDMQLQRVRTISTDVNGNQIESDFDYGVHTPDGSIHWLVGSGANGSMLSVDGSGFQLMLTRGTAPDHSDDFAVLTDGHGTVYQYNRIWWPVGTTSPIWGKNENIISHVNFVNTSVMDPANTVQTFHDRGLPNSIVDSNGNTQVIYSVASDGVTLTDPSFDVFGREFPFVLTANGATPTTDFNGCVSSMTMNSANIFNFPGPDGKLSTIKACYSNFTPSPAFSQPNVEPPNNDLVFKSYPEGLLPVLVSLAMPDGNHWSFTYDNYENLTSITLPTGGTINYSWQEVALPTCQDGSATLVSRAVASRTVNDLVNPPQTWQYTWGTVQQDGSITNYVLDPNGNEIAHVFHSLVSGQPCALYETETRTYQGSHLTGKLLKTVDTHFTADYSNNNDLNFPGNVFADTITTTLPGNKVSQVVRQHDPGPAGSFGVSTLSQVTDEKVYDYSNTLLRETATTYEWQVNSAYFNAGLIDLPASVVIKDGSGCALAETDYTYDEPSYLTTYTGTLPAGTHGAAPGGTVRGNLTTVKKWVAPTSSCSPTSGTAVTSHTNWYDTGEVYQQIDPLGHQTTYTYDPVYDGAYATQTCSPQTGSVTHCVSGTYDSVTGLLESLTNENATTPASGNTQGDSAHTSNYSYDTSWRLIQAQAPPDLANSNARATTVFTPSTPNVFPLSVEHQHSVTTALMDTSTAYFDGADRVNKTTHLLPNGTATVMTTYDGLGQATSVTNPYFTTSDATYGVTSSLFDGLGRVTQTTKQDGSISSVQYNAVTSIAMNADCTISTDEAGKQRGACTDALGRLVEVDEPNPGTTPTVSNYATMQTDGNFVLYNPTNTALWSSGTTTGALLAMQDDGNLVLYHELWQAGTYRASSATSPYDACRIGSQLFIGQILHENQCLESNSGLTFALMTNGELQMYDRQLGQITWTSGTYGHAGGYATITNGNFAIYDASGNLLWSTGTSSASMAELENDGRLIVYNSPWSSQTSQSGITGTLAHPGCDAGTGTGTGGILGAGQCFVSPNGHFELLLQTNGNMAIYDLGVTPANLLWATNTPISPVDPGVALRTLYTYDGLGDLTCVEQHGGVTGTGCSSSPANDATSPWRVRRFTYDSLGRLLTAKNPESGTISYTYDLDGNLLQKTSPAPNQTGSATQTVSYCYDELHRVTGRAYGALSCPLASPVVSYAYDSGANAIGKLVSMTDQAGTATYSYDILGRLATETRSLIGANNVLVSQTLSYEYNLDGSLAKLHYPSGAVVSYTPDSAGRITQAVDSGNGINYVTGATYDATSSLTGFVNGSGGAASITNSYSYNKRLQPVTMSATTPSQTVFSIGYDFHLGNGDNGNVFGITNYKDTSRNQAFTYDPLNRLLSAQNAGTNCTAATANGKTEYWGNSYSYDAWGNLLGKTITKCGAENLSVTADAHNWLHISPNDYQYDAAGNMTYDATANLNYTFDQENRISGAAGYTYTYDDDGNRVRKSNGNLAGNGTLYWYMTPGIVAESDLSGNLKSEYVFFDGERVARKDFSGSTTPVAYYFSDHLKTASVITDSAGTIKAESDYYPWGGELQFVANDSNHYKFTGKERDGETGLDYFGARYYSNALGRWVSADWSATPVPVPYASFADPQTLNLYSYVRNVPTTNADPNGHVCPPCLEEIEEEALEHPAAAASVATAAEKTGEVVEAGGRIGLRAIATPLIVLSYLFNPGTGGGEREQQQEQQAAQRQKNQQTQLGQGRGADEEQSQSDIAQSRTRTNGGIAYSADFDKSLKQNLEPGQKNTVDIEYTGSRSDDAAAANEKAGFKETPNGYTWHHVANYNHKTNTGTMQLVRSKSHRKFHHGGVKQWEDANNKKYRP